MINTRYMNTYYGALEVKAAQIKGCTRVHGESVVLGFQDPIGSLEVHPDKIAKEVDTGWWYIIRPDGTTGFLPPHAFAEIFFDITRTPVKPPDKEDQKRTETPVKKSEEDQKKPELEGNTGDDPESRQQLLRWNS